jgi:hypothetical protein
LNLDRSEERGCIRTVRIDNIGKLADAALMKQSRERRIVMKTLTYHIIAVLLVTLTLGFAAEMAFAGEEGTSIKNVLLDNERVKVVENIRHPGTKVPMHSHKAYIAYFFGPCKMKFTYPHGKTEVKDIPAGKLVWSNGVTHAAEVLGNTDLHTLHIQFKK